MERFNILYIDDSPEAGLERYLDKEYTHEEYETEYADIIFDPNNGYESLIRDPKVQSANVIFIDSRLFENSTVPAGKYSGDGWRILRKTY